MLNLLTMLSPLLFVAAGGLCAPSSWSGDRALPSPRFDPLPPVGERAVLVDRSWRVADPGGLATGSPVQVTGVMKEDWVKDRHGVKVTLERGAPALRYHAIHPETIRAVANQ